MAVAIDRDRWLALGLLLAALALAYLVLLHPWWTVPMQAQAARIEELQQRELRARMQLQQAPQVAQALQRARADVARRPGFLPESTAELATAGLIKRLETVVSEASPGNRACAISNRSPLTEQRQERYPKVAVNVRLRCGVGETSAVLHALESGSPRLFVDNLSVQTNVNFYMATQQATRGGIDVTFDLYGYLRPQPGAARAGNTRNRGGAGNAG